MFEPETEDLLPRSAPKPSVPLESDESTAKPTVPEVSILFGPNAGPMSTPAAISVSAALTATAAVEALQVKAGQPTSYAAWKRQVLPKVIYPPPAIEVRATAASTKITSNNECQVASGYGVQRSTVAASVPPLVGTTVSTAPTQHVRFAATDVVYQPVLQPQRRSLDFIPQYGMPAPVDVLTICAGTQTESLAPIDSPQALQQSVTKADFEQLLEVMLEVRKEQARLAQVCESLMSMHKAFTAHTKVTFKDAATQYSETPIFNGPATQKHVARVYARREDAQNIQPPAIASQNCFDPSSQYQSPRTQPNAQSTAYRANTPLTKRLLQAQNAARKNIAPVAPKALTDKSMVMNELALKYLPDEKINELMKEMQLSPPVVASPLRNIENLEKESNDISNASYRYLKKYRLLPEERDGYQQQHELRRDEVFHRAHPEAHRPGEWNLESEHDALDLERLRHQPKLL